MPRSFHTTEKSKDFKGSMLRLFKSLDRWRYILIVAVVLSLFAATLSTIAPNKLADVTDVISEGIKPNVEELQKVSEEIYKSAIQRYIIYKYSASWGDGTQARVSLEDEETLKELALEFNNLTEQEKKYLLHNIEVDGVSITVDDQIEFIHIIQ